MMQFMRSGATMDKSQSTLYSMSTYLSGSSNSSRTRTMNSSDSNNNVDDDDDDNDESSSEFSFNECDITLIDDDDILCDAKNDGELLYSQVVEMLRFEVEVCYTKKKLYSLNLFVNCPAGNYLKTPCKVRKRIKKIFLKELKCSSVLE